jgi:diguanylate cyclase (GGDEF)-like protein/PAS domain S-box-containing protein
MTGSLVSNLEDNLTINMVTQFKKEEFAVERLQADRAFVEKKDGGQFVAQPTIHKVSSKYFAPLPANEDARLEALRLYDINGEDEEIFNNLVRLAAHTCHSPIAALTFVKSRELVYKSKLCPVPLANDRNGSFCSWAILNPEIFIVQDSTRDERFKTGSLIALNHTIRFYAGVPLATPEGYLIGTLNVMDLKSRELNRIQIEALETLASSVMAHLNIKRRNFELRSALSHRSQLEQQLRRHTDLIKRVEREKDQLSSINAILEKQTTEHQEVIESLSEREEHYSLVVNSTNDGLWDWDLGTNQISYCYRWKKMLGYAQEEIGKSPQEWFKRIHPDDVETVESEITAHLMGLTPQFQNEHRIRHRDGKYRWILCRGMAIWETNREAYRMAGSITDITEQKEAEELLVYNAFHDSLTGLPNRTLFMNKLKRALARISEGDDYLFAILFLDLDRFKVINDSLGHHVGDQLLIALSKRLEAAIRPGDMVARLGGDEFAIILDRIKSVDDATHAAARIQQDLVAPFKLSGHEVVVSASIGISHNLVPYNSPEEFIRNADIAMYRAKEQGRGSFELFDMGMQERVSERLQLEVDLRRALSRQEFQVHFQPIISLDNWCIMGFEALARWKHPEKGFISPLKFIPIAEETGLIIEIGSWVLQESCRQIRQWQDMYPSDPPLFISVNLSGVQFCDPNLISTIKGILSETGINAGSLKIEITESAIIENIEAATAILNRIKALGIKISLDDFGTGYSSLSYLHRFPIDTLKIDRSFITAMNMAKNAEIVSTILTLAKNLGMDVIAEGVETREQIIKLTDMKCEYVQGFMLSKPMDGRSMSLLIAETHQKGMGQHAHTESIEA